MKFRIAPVEGLFPELDYPASPNELSLFFPAGHSCEQINYGQGEGQVLIDGMEWCFYYNDNGDLSVVLHEAGLSNAKATAVVEAICERLSTSTALSWQVVDRDDALA